MTWTVGGFLTTLLWMNGCNESTGLKSHDAGTDDDTGSDAIQGYVSGIKWD